MNDGWSGRSVRERDLIALAGVLALGVIDTQALLGPSNNAVEAARADYANTAQTHRALAQLAALRSPPSDLVGSGSDRVRAQLARAGEQGVLIARIQPETEGAITVWIDAIAPTTLFGWIAGLSREHGVEVRSLRVEREDAGGVTAQITFVGAPDA